MFYAQTNIEDNEKVNPSSARTYGSRLDEAQGFSEVWELVKDTVRNTLGERRVGMMLFLDDLSLNVGAYHPLGTNNIVLNRALIEIVEGATKSRPIVNAFVYTLLLHEYLHALGHIPESEVRSLVYQVSKESFGENSIVSVMAKKGPRSILENIPLGQFSASSKRAMEIVRDFDKTNHTYIS
ncbi:MAG: hypothetical protein JSV12_04175 [Candidatus Bathyarchaeota archaeon]|nr:MAG: hypothetical protein JSV12_04175 [Candidatus Bathyarchaeota archaeon]